MRQIILKRLHHAGYGNFGAGTRGVLQGGIGTMSHGTLSFGAINPKAARTPFAVPLTLKNLLVTTNIGDGPPNSLELIVMKNDVNTALKVSIPSGSYEAENTTDIISYAAGDDVSLRLMTTATTPLGFEMGVSVEANTEGVEQVYSSAPISGGTPGTVDVGDIWIGGTFDNGYYIGYAGIEPNSNNYSICAVPGSITKIMVKNLSALTSGGGWTVRFKISGVVHGTTTTFMDDEGATVIKSVNIPIALTQRVDTIVQRIGQPAVSDYTHVGVSIAYTPTVPGQFMLCGGSNDAIGGVNPSWLWNRNNQNSLMVYSRTQMMVGHPGFVALGLYMERGATAPGRGSVISLLKNGVNTDIQFTMDGLVTSGSDLGNISFGHGDTTSIHIEPYNSSTQAGGKWGLAVKAPDDRSGVYFLTPSENKHDIYYIDEKKIPDPTIKTAIVGE